MAWKLCGVIANKIWLVLLNGSFNNCVSKYYIFIFLQRKFSNWQQCLIPSNDLIKKKSMATVFVPYKGTFCLLVIRLCNCFYFAPSLRLVIILTLNFSSFFHPHLLKSNFFYRECRCVLYNVSFYLFSYIADFKSI